MTVEGETNAAIKGFLKLRLTYLPEGEGSAQPEANSTLPAGVQ